MVAASASSDQVHPSVRVTTRLWDDVFGSKIAPVVAVGDTLARQIERACEVALGRMDESDGETLEPTIAEEAFVALARSAWRQANAKQKRELTHFFKASRA